nr:putative methyl transferase [uncultured bacterium]
MENKDQIEPCGRALLHYFYGDLSAEVSWRPDNGTCGSLPVQFFFRSQSELSRIEQLALEQSAGPVLDVGAGAGLHALALQDRGVEVVALDISEHAVAVMRNRGVTDVWCGDVLNFKGGPFKTVLMLWHGLGVVGDLQGLDRFLAHARTLIAGEGQILADSLDLRKAVDDQYRADRRRTGTSLRYFGEIRMQFEYQGKAGPLFSVLHVDPRTLEAHASRLGWRTQVLTSESNGDYLVRLTRSE